MRIATWNVNSLTVRLPHLLKWCEEEKPDILALQEIKMENHKFPEKVFKTAGYYAIASGQKTYNGVAVLSRWPMTNVEMPDGDEQRRILRVTIEANPPPAWQTTPFFKGGEKICIVNAYVPNGESPESPKYTYKLNWLSSFEKYLSQQLKKTPNLVVLGDFNIAPQDEDVHDPKEWVGHILCSDLERQALQKLLNLGLTDSFRLFPQAPKTYSWWDYRQFAFRRNAGLRIDHILISEPLKAFCQACKVDKTTRGWERPSDHAPVMMDLG